MTLPSRAIVAYIPPAAFNKLTATMDLDLCWSLFRKFIGHQLFGPAYASVPFMTVADYFGQLFVFVKEQRSFTINSVLSSLNLRPPTYKIIGNLDYMINSKSSTWTPQFDISPWDIMDGLMMAPDFRIRLDSSVVFREIKEVEMVVRRPRVRYVEMPESINFSLHMNLLADLKTARHIYVITEVVYASYAKFTLKVGASEKCVTYERDIPIGMRYRKFQVRRDGKILRELPTRLRFGLKDVCWLRPKAQPIPKVLRYPDELNRERKIRTVLTVTASEADGNKQSSHHKVSMLELQNALDQRPGIGNDLEPSHREQGEDDVNRENSNETVMVILSPPPSLNSDVM